MLLCGVMGVGSRTAEGAESSAPMPGSFRNPAAVEEVRRGERTVANAAWWGFDPVDATEAIQSAIDSRAAKVIVPYVGAEWVVRPVTLASNQELVLDPGVVVVAKPRRVPRHARLAIHRYGRRKRDGTGVWAVLRMWQEDYVSGAYEQSEFRHTLAFRGSGKIAVLGLTLEHSGGDGIYLGPIEDERRLGCRDVLIRDCVCRNNYRQGDEPALRRAGSNRALRFPEHAGNGTASRARPGAGKRTRRAHRHSGVELHLRGQRRERVRGECDAVDTGFAAGGRPLLELPGKEHATSGSSSHGG